MKSIFVSSTFRDMHEERDIIHERVLPELNEYALQYGESVSFCDLRWGVNTENLESEEGARKVLEVCFDEIDRCKPYMLVILGERYGWIPEKELVREMAGGRKEIMLEDLEKSVTALEIEYGALQNREQLEHTLFYFREFEGPVPEEYAGEDEMHKAKLDSLKERIRRLAGNNLYTYTVRWDAEKGILLGIDGFAAQVTENLKKLMEDEWKIYARLSPFARDNFFQWDYVRQKAEQFRARSEVITACLNALQKGQRLLAVTGETGSGKSTLMGRLAVELTQEGKEVLPLFCGSTSLCNDALDLIRYIVCYIEERFGLEHLEINGSAQCDQEKEETLSYSSVKTSGDTRHDSRTEIERWSDRLREMCSLYTAQAGRELIILVDGVDQLFADEVRNHLRFIPENLSDKVRMIYSCLDSFHPEQARNETEKITLLPLKEGEKRCILEGILHFIGRELSVSVMDRLAEKKGADSPLYLSLAIARLEMMDKNDFEKIATHGEGIAAITSYQKRMVFEMPDNMEELCMDVLYAASERVGGNIAEKAVRYIAVSRYGLREKDLEEIFCTQGIEWSSLDFTRFIRYMKTFFMLREDGRWDFTHRIIRNGFLKYTMNVNFANEFH